jgi:hypothetical protein
MNSLLRWRKPETGLAAVSIASAWTQVSGGLTIHWSPIVHGFDCQLCHLHSITGEGLNEETNSISKFVFLFTFICFLYFHSMYIYIYTKLHWINPFLQSVWNCCLLIVLACSSSLGGQRRHQEDFTKQYTVHFDKIGLYFMICEIKSVLATRRPVLLYFYLKVSDILKICLKGLSHQF